MTKRKTGIIKKLGIPLQVQLVFLTLFYKESNLS